MTGGVLEDNAASIQGGGLFVDGGSSITFSGVDITGNQAYGAYGKGGGFYIVDVAVTFSGCDLTGNTATVLGAGGAYFSTQPTQSGGTWTDAVTQDN